MKRQGDTLEILPPVEGGVTPTEGGITPGGTPVKILSSSGLTSPPMKKLCLEAGQTSPAFSPGLYFLLLESLFLNPPVVMHCGLLCIIFHIFACLLLDQN